MRITVQKKGRQTLRKEERGKNEVQEKKKRKEQREREGARKIELNFNESKLIATSFVSSDFDSSSCELDVYLDGFFFRGRSRNKIIYILDIQPE